MQPETERARCALVVARFAEKAERLEELIVAE